MAKKTLVRDQDKFMLRLPDGMRERIKAKAERAGMSMNEAIVWCLDQYFPAPATLADRVKALAISVAALKRGNDLETEIDTIVDEIDSTLREIADGKLDASKSFSKLVSERIEEWDMDALEAANDRPFDDDSYGYSISNLNLPGREEGWEDPFPDPPIKDKD